jgi:hypothetical protein
LRINIHLKGLPNLFLLRSLNLPWLHFFGEEAKPLNPDDLFKEVTDRITKLKANYKNQ